MNEYVDRIAAVGAACIEGNMEAAERIQHLPSLSPNELIAAAIKQLDSEGIFKQYLKLSECLFRSIKDRQGEDTITIGCERPGTKIEVSITLKDGEENDPEA